MSRTGREGSTTSSRGSADQGRPDAKKKVMRFGLMPIKGGHEKYWQALAAGPLGPCQG